MKKVVLFGGSGFLGSGVREQLAAKKLPVKSIDISDYDLADAKNVDKSVMALKDADYVVMLAAKVGVKIFDKQPIEAAAINRAIDTNLLTAMKIASEEFGRKYNVTYFSTSEVYGSKKSPNDLISDDSCYMFNIPSDRQLYSKAKYWSELDLKKELMERCGAIKCLKILRPFNVYGKNQKRGVVYEMVKSALAKKAIWYATDTTRTFTDIHFFSSAATDIILADRSFGKNVADARCSLCMKDVAELVSDAVGIGCKLIPLPPDPLVRYRQVSAASKNVNLSRSVMAHPVMELAKQLRGE